MSRKMCIAVVPKDHHHNPVNLPYNTIHFVKLSVLLIQTLDGNWIVCNECSELSTANLHSVKAPAPLMQLSETSSYFNIKSYLAYNFKDSCNCTYLSYVFLYDALLLLPD